MKQSKIDTISCKWREFIINGENPSLELLYPYSRINLKKNKNLRKFNKYYCRYVDTLLLNEYWGLLIFRLVYKVTSKIFSLSLPPVESFNEQPKL